MSTDKQFGEFFRASRKALGLTLRDFCRRNGFDPGNVSRLERGLVAPPKAQHILESYAKALKLKGETDRWDRFFALAGAATGRIPQELFLSRRTAARLPSLFRRLSGGPGHHNWVTARHLEEWANSQAARTTLPQLIRRLVYATGKRITAPIEFHAGEQTQRPGPDGVVEAAGADAFVPEGKSIWEVSAEKHPVRKAERDFAKRRKYADKNTTYVVVTPQRCQEKGDWVEAKTKLGIWKDVRFYDSATLEEWLERAPAVDVWLARILELRPEGLTDIDEYWANLEALTEPSLKTDVFLGSRVKEAEELKKWLKGPAGAMLIKTRSPSEAVDFVAAVCREVTSSPSERDAIAALTLIVESKEAWRAIARSDTELVLIAHPTLPVEPEMVAEAVRQGHRVILSSGQVSRDRALTLELHRVARSDLQRALVSSGLDHARASDNAAKSGGSLTVLKRLLGRFPGTTQPTWSRQPEASALVPVLLAGGWEEWCAGDRQVLERLSNQSYSELSAVAERWVHHEDPPIAHVLSRWDLVSRDDSWFLLASAVTQNHLERFETVALDVLGENDPVYELVPDERWMAKIKQKVLDHSQSLRTGLAETLALLGGRPERTANAPDLSGRVGHVVRRLLDGQDWKRWASLSPQLPLLAEAAPDAFLDALERDLDPRRAESEVLKLFQQEGGALFPSSPHTGLLWALEGLAWDRSLLPKVSFILADLEERTSPGKLANRPMKSLQEIFKPWFPQATAPVEERVKVLSVLTKKSPAAGWRLLLSLLPDRVGFADHVRRPAFRDWALAWTEGATSAEYAQQITACANMLVDLLGKDPGRWKEAIRHLENLPGPAAEAFLERLRAFDVSTLDENSRQTITEALRDKIALHSRMSNAGWTLPEKILIELEAAQRRFEPEDVVTRHAWLFDDIWRVQEKAGGIEDDEIRQIRRAAVEEVEGEGGWDKVLALAEAASAPEELGAVLGETASTRNDSKVLPGLLRTANENTTHFARGYVLGRFKVAGWGWVNGLNTAEWDAKEIGEIALVLPQFGRETWDFVAGKGSGVEEHYWRNTSHRSLGTDWGEVEHAVSMLLKYHRPFHACSVLGMALYKKCPLDLSLLTRVLEVGLEPNDTDSGQAAVEPARHFLLELLQELQKAVKRKDPEVDPRRVARLEWGYLGMLDGHPASPDTLLGMLKSDPTFFVELLCLTFRSGHDPEEPRTEPSEEDRARAQNAYRLLMLWQSVPGCREDNSVDEDALFEWLQKARSMAEQHHCLEECDHRIGNVFAHAPFEQDGSWPCIPVRDAIEELASDDVADGLEVGIYNKRGAYMKSPEEGGKQERDFAKRYQDWAEACKIEWPRTAASLWRVADGYAAEARREDAVRELRW